VSRWDVPASVSAVQPPVWTFLEFEADDAVAGPLAESLARSLLAEGGFALLQRALTSPGLRLARSSEGVEAA